MNARRFPIPSRPRVRRTAIVGWALLACLTATASGYLDAPVEKLTLPELVKEFKSIEAVTAKAVDLEKGYVVWSRTALLQGTRDATDAKHLLKIHGKVPPALEKLKAGDPAVFLSLDGWDRGVVLVAGCWYVVGYEADSRWWRIAYTDLHYDLNVAFAGSPEQLAAAIKQLLAGEAVTVRCHAKPKEDALQTVRYTMNRPKEKRVVTEPPGTQPQR